MCHLSRGKYHGASGMRCQVDEHLLSSHAYSDKYGGSTTLLRCASAVIGDHKSSVLDVRNVIPLEDLCPYHQHVHLVASQQASSPYVERTSTEGGADRGDDCRKSSELELPGHGAGAGLAAYDRLPIYVSAGVLTTTATSAAIRPATRTSRTAGSSRQSFVTFKPQTTTSNIVRADSPEGAAGTAPSSGSCVSLDLIKSLRASTGAAHAADTVEKSQEGDGSSPHGTATVTVTGCVSQTQQPPVEACSAV